jgi:hypothetical protein
VRVVKKYTVLLGPEDHAVRERIEELAPGSVDPMGKVEGARARRTLCDTCEGEGEVLNPMKGGPRNLVGVFTEEELVSSLYLTCPACEGNRTSYEVLTWGSPALDAELLSPSMEEDAILAETYDKFPWLEELEMPLSASRGDIDDVLLYLVRRCLS